MKFDFHFLGFRLCGGLELHSRHKNPFDQGDKIYWDKKRRSLCGKFIGRTRGESGHVVRPAEKDCPDFEMIPIKWKATRSGAYIREEADGWGAIINRKKFGTIYQQRHAAVRDLIRLFRGFTRFGEEQRLKNYRCEWLELLLEPPPPARGVKK